MTYRFSDSKASASVGRFSIYLSLFYVCWGIGYILQSLKFDREPLFAIERELVVKRKKKEATTSEGE